MRRIYDGYLIFAKKTEDELASIRRVLNESPLRASVEFSALEIDYEGRDSGREVVSSLRRLAAVVRDATGEIRCTVDHEGDEDDSFEFYKIKEGRLWKQEARLERLPWSPVD